MATDGGDVEFAYRLKLEKWAQDLAKATGLQVEETRKLVGSLDRAQRAVDRAGKKTAKELEKEFKERFGNIKRGSSAVFGGVVNDLEDVVGALGAIGPGAAVFALLTAGAIGAGAAVVGLVAHTDDLLDALKPLRDQEGFGFSREQIDEVERANRALDGIGMTGKAAAATLGVEFAPAVGDASFQVLRLALAGLQAAKAYTGTHDVLHELAVFLTDSLVQAVTAPVSSLMHVVDAVAMLDRALGLDGAAQGLEGLSAAWDDWTRSTAEGIVGATGAKFSLEELADQYGVSTEEAEEFLDAMGRFSPEYKKQQDNAKKLADLLADVAGRELDGIDKIDDQYNKLIETAVGYGANEKQLGIIEAARHAAKMKFIDDEVEAEREQMKETAEAREKAEEEEEERHKRGRIKQLELYKDHLERIEREQEARMDALIEYARAYQSVFAGIADQASEFAQREFDEQSELVDSLQEQRKEALAAGDKAEAATLDKRIKAAKRAALDAFRMQQAAAISKIAVETLVNVVEAAPNPGLSAAQVALGALATGAVLAEPAPKLYVGDGDGTDPDGRVVELHRNEKVANDRLSRNDGDAIAEGNRTGRLPSSGPAQAVLSIDGRSLSGVLAYGARQAGEFRDLLDEVRDRPGASRRSF
jgi:hypothetical protein